MFRNIKESISEICWPARKDNLRQTIVVVCACAIVGAILMGADMLFMLLLG